MTFTLIETAQDLAPVESELWSAESIALDCEAAGFHRYSDRLCLMQLTVDDRTFLIDTLAVDPSETLEPILQESAPGVLMHGADYDIRLIRRDLGLHIRGLFDTQIAAALLGEPAIGLQALLDAHLGVHIPKKFQRADWAVRPLPEAMLEYATSDTVHLHALVDRLRERLEAAGRLSWAEEEFRVLEGVADQVEESESVDPVTRVKGARDLEPRELAVLREALEWRDRIARDRDRALFRVAHDAVLLDVARALPAHVGALREVAGLSSRLIDSHGEALVERIEPVLSRPESSLEPYPRRSPSGRGRPEPEVEERVSRLKEVRNAVADELGVDKGVLISNAVLQEVATRTPATLEALAGVPGVRRWQVERMGDALLEKI